MAEVEVVIGRVGRAHGIRGEVAVDVLTDEPARRFHTGAVLMESSTVRRVFTVESVRWHKDKLLIKFSEVADRSTAEGLFGTELTALVSASELPSGKDEYFDRQLVGLQVRCCGDAVGVVVEVIHSPGQDLLVVDTTSGRRLVPFVAELVPVVDLISGWLQVADIPGLLDDSGAVVVSQRSEDED